MEEVLDQDLKNVDTKAPVVTKDKAIFTFEGTTEDAIASKVNDLFIKDGYSLEEGTQLKGKYGKGSKIMRILLGAFVKRFAWEVTISTQGGLTTATLYKETKGYAGGAIGVNQVNKEFKRLVGVWETI
ncbi:MAG: hypothetical protein NWQ27_05785 [Crocinitomicaceae bacterium]|jgi:hypothetical protein|nr:hypothetical protein [Crocinitomicaceae bacterium]MDP5099484.1 hypothetical protein [Crocinitomicaceae bacterium]